MPGGSSRSEVGPSNGGQVPALQEQQTSYKAAQVACARAWLSSIPTFRSQTLFATVGDMDWALWAVTAWATFRPEGQL